MRVGLPMRPSHLNIYAFDEGDSWTIVDTGMNVKSVRAEWQALLVGPLAAKPVGRVILTHYHPDHVGLVGWFQKEHGAELWCTQATWLFARMLTLDVQTEYTKETIAFWKAAGMDEDILAERQSSKPFCFADVVYPMPLGYRRIYDSETVSIGDKQWTVRMGQGHAPDQATFWGVDHDLVLAADQVLPRITPNLGVYATEPEADSVGAWIKSCKHLREFARANQLALPGHQMPFTGLDARLDQLVVIQTDALEELLEYLAEPRRASDCFDVLYGRRIGKSEYGLALVEAVGHLNHLHQTGRVTRSKNEDGAWLWKAVGD
ncbi:MBL fold metallo-hydrolase [Amaricoccus tamworthensis]|uniref:MBL fold metallo-hydrolase n=1 Tax=Amaricoccus tamworthensis TaxID=57002 RepID=UPI003C7D9CAB